MWYAGANSRWGVYDCDMGWKPNVSRGEGDKSQDVCMKNLNSAGGIAIIRAKGEMAVVSWDGDGGGNRPSHTPLLSKFPTSRLLLLKPKTLFSFNLSLKVN